MSPFDPEVAEAIEAWGKDDSTWREDAWPGTPTGSKKSPGDLLQSVDERPSTTPDSNTFRLQRSSSEPQLRPRSQQSSRDQKSQRSQSKPLGPASQRFSKEELQCFKRIPGPSSAFEEKLAVYWHSTGELRMNLSKENWHQMPVLKGKFYHCAKLKQSLVGPSAAEKAKEEERLKRLEAAKKKAEEVEPLASEPEVTYVLDRIFPRNPKKKEESKPIPKPRRASMLEQYGGYAGRGPSPSKLNPREQRESSSQPSQCGSSRHAPAKFSPQLPGFGTSSRGAMEAFRAKLLEKFTTIKEAFETFMKDLPERQITKLELARVLARHGLEWQSKQVRDSIFDRLDFKSVGRVTMVGFYVLVEASAPVRSVEDLRRRWLACRYTMSQAIMIMADNSQVALTHRLTLQEFGSRLQLVNVNDPEEHLAVFKAVCIESDIKPQGGSRITLGDLAAALAVVSPCLLLEDMRDKLQRRYHGGFKKAFSDLDMDRSGTVSHTEFVVKMMDRLHVTELEARKMFREIDVDGSQEISRNEFVCAIGLSEPSLILEDLRKKVRQRFRSFKAQFADAYHDSPLVECAAAPKLTLKNFQEFLLPLSMSERETKVLFNLIDINHDGRLTVKEFVRGVRHFAPASVLEDLRMRCCQQHERLSDPFMDLDHHELLDSSSFAQKMVDIGFCDRRKSDPRLAELQPGVTAQALFDILDVANTGEATFSRLLAALQSCGAGTAQRLSAMELDMRAKNDVKHDLAPMHKLVAGVKLQARQGLRHNEEVPAPDENEFRTGTRIFESLLDNVDTDFDNTPVVDAEQETLNSYKGPPRLKMMIYEDVLRKYQNQAQSLRAARATAPLAQMKRPILNAAHGASDSWTRFWASVQKSPQKREHEKLEKDLHLYFQSAAMKLSHDGPLYHGTEQRLCPDPFLDKSHLEQFAT